MVSGEKRRRELRGAWPHAPRPSKFRTSHEWATTTQPFSKSTTEIDINAKNNYSILFTRIHACSLRFPSTYPRRKSFVSHDLHRSLHAAFNRQGFMTPCASPRYPLTIPLRRHSLPKFLPEIFERPWRISFLSHFLAQMGFARPRRRCPTTSCGAQRRFQTLGHSADRRGHFYSPSSSSHIDLEISNSDGGHGACFYRPAGSLFRPVVRQLHHWTSFRDQSLKFAPHQLRGW